MRRTSIAAMFAPVVLAAGGLLIANADDRSARMKTPAAEKMAKPNYKSVIAKWDAKPREVAEKMAKKYGVPDEITDSMLIWHDTGPWKRTVVHKHEIAHNFPKPHTDIVEQFIDFKAPLDKVDDIISYDGSVVIKRTEGELSARCDNEAMNFLAINLANDVANGNKSVDVARKTYAETAMAFMQGKKPEITQKLTFSIDKNTRDPDRAMPLEQQAKR